MKYSLIVVTTILAILGWTKSGQPEAWITVVVIGLIVMAMIFQISLELISIKENKKLKEKVDDIHKQSQKEPEYELLLNDKVVLEGKEISIALDKNKFPFVFTLRNMGEASAEELYVHLYLLDSVVVPHLGRHWKNQGRPTTHNGLEFESWNGVLQYSFISPASIHPKDWMKLGSGYLDENSMVVNPMPIKVKVTSKNGIKAHWEFKIKFE